jgi:hypothetical protein
MSRTIPLDEKLHQCNELMTRLEQNATSQLPIAIDAFRDVCAAYVPRSAVEVSRMYPGAPMRPEFWKLPNPAPIHNAEKLALSISYIKAFKAVMQRPE